VVKKNIGRVLVTCFNTLGFIGVIGMVIFIGLRVAGDFQDFGWWGGLTAIFVNTPIGLFFLFLYILVLSPLFFIGRKLSTTSWTDKTEQSG